MEEKKQIKCPNCENLYDEGFSFCPHCGQKADDDLTIGVLFYNTISNYFSFDARFLKSFIPLMFKPGYLAKEFVQGKRLLFLHPAQMYLFVTVIFFFISSFYVRESREQIDKAMQEVVAEKESISQKGTQKVVDSMVTDFVAEKEANLISRGQKVMDSIKLDSIRRQTMDHLIQNKDFIGLKEEDLKLLDSISKVEVQADGVNTNFDFDLDEIDSLITTGANDQEIYKAMGLGQDDGFFKRKVYTQFLKLYKTMGVGQIYQAFIDSLPLAMFFLLPLFALFFKIFFFKRGPYAHHLVFSFYYFSFLFVLFSLIFAVNRWIYPIPDWIDWLIVFSTFFYLVAAVIKFYQQNWILSFIKSGIISFFFLIVVMPVAFLLLGFIAFLFY